MLDCTDIFWQHFYKGAGITLSVLLPLLLGFAAVMLTNSRLQQRHDERMQAARLEAEQQRESCYRVVRGGQG